MRKISATVYITEAQDRALKALSGVTRVPVAEYIRQGIDAALRHYGYLGEQGLVSAAPIEVVSE